MDPMERAHGESPSDFAESGSGQHVSLTRGPGSAARPGAGRAGFSRRLAVLSRRPARNRQAAAPSGAGAVRPAPDDIETGVHRADGGMVAGTAPGGLSGSGRIA